MYGYVRPERGELRIREYETFRGVYCGLCHTLKKRYGPLFRFAVNYDLTFLAMVLAGPETPETTVRRCPYHPLRKTACPCALPALDAAADYTVILAYWKLRDAAADSGGIKALGSRLLAAAIRGAYRKAAAARPAFAATAERELEELSALEKDACPSIDAPADKFARILEAASEGAGSPERERVLRQLLYHLGRIVYVLDAADDLEEDIRDGSYNPLRFRYEPREGKLAPEDAAQLRMSLQHSHDRISTAFVLLEKNPYTEILSNILYFGLPAVTQAVFTGRWRAAGRTDRERSLHL